MVNCPECGVAVEVAPRDIHSSEVLEHGDKTGALCPGTGSTMPIATYKERGYRLTEAVPQLNY